MLIGLLVIVERDLNFALRIVETSIWFYEPQGPASLPLKQLNEQFSRHAERRCYIVSRVFTLL